MKTFVCSPSAAQLKCEGPRGFIQPATVLMLCHSNTDVTETRFPQIWFQVGLDVFITLRRAHQRSVVNEEYWEQSVLAGEPH